MSQSVSLPHDSSSQPSESTPAHLTGACLCGTITYSLSAKPRKSVLCHCLNCKKASGSSFMANDWHSSSDLTVTTGKSSLKTYIDSSLDSNGELERQFCGECGSPLFFKTPNFSQWVIVTSGTKNELEDMAREWRPTEQYYCKRRMEWIPEIEGSKKFDVMT